MKYLLFGLLWMALGFSQPVVPTTMDFNYWFYRHRIHREFSKPGSLPLGTDCPDPFDANLSGFQLVAHRLHPFGNVNRTMFGDEQLLFQNP